MHGDINRGFVAKRYDATSVEPLRTREELIRTVNNLLRLIENFIQGK